ncbi:hypothetical protein KUC3_22880 [Alteromonas sp. KC3]|uniref:toxin-antitoxin system YwqK family antitoxin n=1 Tax=unclassified Alteromonas TaxID=2614992 RepID=UPI001924A079|nr:MULTISPECIES: toxin-antitoxin system YwqK family antitoxin [unclassified Alteromonas]BCO19431.1 hypothetical protein KUC3_22880 [Alteromonas sp. KC3]BCO23393.1 hypothetical protein KUC14_22620 [Alteromonas sp. KC14]
MQVMRRKFTFFGLLLLVCLVFLFRGEVSRVDSSEISVNSAGLRVYNHTPFTGEVISYHSNGNVSSREDFVEGRRQGVARKWFADGTLAYEAHYQNGIREGYTRSWWFNGNQRSETFYESGKTQGQAWLWYRNGNKFKRFNFEAGQPSGLQQAWRLNGILFSNFEYKNGRIFGLRKLNNCVGLEDEKISVDYYRNQAGNS